MLEWFKSLPHLISAPIAVIGSLLLMALLAKPARWFVRRMIVGPPNNNPELDKLAGAALDHIQTKMRRQAEIDEAKHQARLAKARRGELDDDEEPRF